MERRALRCIRTSQRSRPVYPSAERGPPTSSIKRFKGGTLMKKTLLVLLAALVLPPASALAATKVAAGGPIVIGMSVPGLQFPFFVTMKNDAEKAAAKLGAKIVFADA